MKSVWLYEYKYDFPTFCTYLRIPSTVENDVLPEVGLMNYILFTFPTGVDPVNDICLMVGLLHRVLPTSAELSLLHVITFNTPGGNPAFSAN